MGKTTVAATKAWRAQYAPTPEAMSEVMRSLTTRRSHLLRLGRALEAALAEVSYEAAPADPELARTMEPPPMS